MRIIRSSPIIQSPRVQQVLGLFDVPPMVESEQTWEVELLLPPRWNLGIIVGPSGCGKSTISRERFGANVVSGFDWPPDRSLLDAFPAKLSVRDIVGLLSSVGFSSPPAWVRPFGVLSTGQQFRVNLARALAEAMVDGQMKVIDEYSSVVDRTVARIGSAAVAKTVRRHNLQLIAVTCHYDVLDWLEPDWVYEPHLPSFQARGLLQRWFTRPEIDLEIIRTDRSAWRLFKPYHYLSGDLHHSAQCYAALVEGQAAAFTAVLFFPHPKRSGWREHRTVCLPDFQGVGIGNALSEFVAGLYRSTGKPYTSTTSHPAMIRHRCRSPLWRMTRKPALLTAHSSTGMGRTTANDRLTAGFEFVGPGREMDARRFGLDVKTAKKYLATDGAPMNTDQY